MGELKKETRDAWSREKNENKDLIVAQFAGNSKAIVLVTKNHNLCTAYSIDFVDSDGYESDYTNNSEGIYTFVANSAIYDNTDNGSIGESDSEENKLNGNAASSTRPKKSILKGNGKKIFKSSEMPAGSIHKMMADKQLEVRDPVTK